jgi:hypothetical protein
MGDKDLVPQDRSRINVNDGYERRYWSDMLRVTEQQLRNGVSAVGPSVEKVRKYLNRSLLLS